MEHFGHAMAFSDPLTIEGVEKRTPWQTVKATLPFLWPKDRADMRARVVIALLCLLLGRAANVYGPIVLKELIDGLESLIRSASAINQEAAIAGLISLALLYGLTVLLPGMLTEIRAVIFTPVSEFAQRVIGLKTYRHKISSACAMRLNPVPS